MPKNQIPVLVPLLLLSLSLLFPHLFPGQGEGLLHVVDPCDSYGDCVSASLTYTRANPDDSLYLGDQFYITATTTPGSGSSGSTSWVGSLEGISWSYDAETFSATIDGPAAHFIVIENATGGYTITTTATFLVSITTCTTSSSGQTAACSTSYTQTAVPVSETVFLRAFVLTFQTRLVNVTGADGFILRNGDGSFYRNDSFCDSWNATFLFASQRTDIRINAASITPPSLDVLDYSVDHLGRVGRFCYTVRTDSAYRPSGVVLKAVALNWRGATLGLRKSTQPFAVVQYDPEFTSYAYMLYRNSTTSSSLQRPWVLLVRYDGNLPGYSYEGDRNTNPFNGKRTLGERAFFSDFHYTTLSYQAYTTGGEFRFHVINGTSTVEYNWQNRKDSAPLDYGRRIEKYVFNASGSSLTPLLSQGFIYQNITMVGCWQHENTCNLRQNYWLVPFLWNGRLNVVSVDSNGNRIPSTPITLAIQNPAPLDTWLTDNFERVFGNDKQVLRAFKADLYATNQTMSFNQSGRLSVWLNQTSLSPPLITITAGGVSLGGTFTFVPTYVNSPIASVPNSVNGAVYYANATIPMWAYNMLGGSLAYIPVATAIDHPSTFLELVNSSGWVAGNTTAPQTPSAFASQQYGFWPLGGNVTVYVNIQGGGVRLLGTQKVGPDDYLATFYIEPWSGGITKVQLVEGRLAWEPQPSTSASPYQSPLPPSVTGFYSVSYPPTGGDTKAVFTNPWGAMTTVDLGTALAPSPPTSLIPATTVAVFGIAFMLWFVVSSILRMRKSGVHE